MKTWRQQCVCQVWGTGVVLNDWNRRAGLKRWGQLPLFLRQLLQKSLKFSGLHSPPLLAVKLFLWCVCVCVCVCVSVCLCVRALTHACMLSRVQLFVTSWTVAHQAPLPMELPRILEWGAISYSRGSYWPRQGSNLRLLHLLHWQAGSLPLVPPGKTFTPIIALS